MERQKSKRGRERPARGLRRARERRQAVRIRRIVGSDWRVWVTMHAELGSVSKVVS